LELADKLVEKSKLTEEDADELGEVIKEGMLKHYPK
jgi:hypothetical protein